MLVKFFKLFLILLLYQSPLYSKNTSLNDFNARYLSNYFSGIVAYENLDNTEALKFFNSSEILIKQHDAYLERYVFSLVLDGKVEKAINQVKQNSTKNNSDFFQANLLLAIDSLKKKNFKNKSETGCIRKAVEKHAEGCIELHKANIEVYLANPAGIGEHSDIMEAIQAELDKSAALKTTGASPNRVVVTYDYATQGFKFVDGTNLLSVKAGSVAGNTAKNEVLGFPVTPVTLNDSGLSGLKAVPNGVSERATVEQRFGMKVEYDSVNKIFTMKSGTTGDQSSIAISEASDIAKGLFGFSNTSVTKSTLATRGISSTPAVAIGTTPTINLANNFAVDATNNTFVVTVDGIKGTVVLPIDSNYSLSTFMSKLEKGINAMGTNPTVTGGTPTTVNGVKVSYDAVNNKFVFTTGSKGADSFIKISGSSNWGLETVEAGRGNTSTWIYPTQHKDVVSGALQPKYIDGAGAETTNGDGFTTLPAWSPIYLDKGELTFDTGGNLVSPVEGTQLETVYLAGGKGALTINIDYSASTQFSSAFAVLSQSQDGAPEGDLVGVTIGNDGLVSASFSNGTQKSLAKILLVNFSSPVGLRQIGDSSFLASAASGKPILGTAGSAGFGTLRAGATERANVDLTQELVDLITAQRNFQANAKAIETSSTMTSAIINLRS